MASLIERIEAAASQRPSLVVTLKSFLASDVEGEIRMRALNMAEESDAAKCAVDFRKAVLSALPDRFVQEFLADPTFLDDARTVEKMWRACRDADDVNDPAFPSAQWMRQQMTAEELTTLYGFYEKAIIAAGKTSEHIDRDQLMFIAYAAAAASTSSETDEQLMGIAKPVLVDMFIRLSGEYSKAVPPVAAALA